MAVHDYVVANGTGSAVRQDINNALAAIVSNNSGSSEPGTTYAYQWWADTNANVLKIRNSANNAWITLRELDGTMLIEDGSASSPGLAFADDTNTGIFRSADNTINFATAGAERLEIGSTAIVVNDSSNDVDFRVESNGQTHMLFVDAGKDAVGIGTTPEQWEAGQFFALQIGKGGALYGRAAGDEDRNGLTSNCYHASDGWKYIAASAHATRYDQSDGNHIWFTAGTGTADAAVSFSETARIDTSGRLLVGTSSYSSTRPSGAIHLDNTSTTPGFGNISLGFNGTTADNHNVLNFYRTRGTSSGAVTIVQSGDHLGSIAFSGADGTDAKSQAAQIYAQVDGSPASNDMPGRLILATTADGAASPTERVRIDSSGDVGIGETAPLGKLHVKTGDSGASSVGASADEFVIEGSANTGMTILSGTTNQGLINFGDSDDVNVGNITYDHNSNFMSVKTNDTERLRILNNGDISTFDRVSINNSGTHGYNSLAVDGTSASNHVAYFKDTRTDSASGAGMIQFRRTNGVVGTISTSTSATSYNTSSDYRLKENVVDLDGAIARVKQLAPKRFNFIADDSTTVDGFLAHEAQTVVPEAVTGTHNEVDEDDNPVYQGIDQSKLVPLLTAALQEAIAKIETLETKVAALEAG